MVYVTPLMSQLLMSGLQAVLPENMAYMSVMARTSQLEIGP